MARSSRVLKALAIWALFATQPVLSNRSLEEAEGEVDLSTFSMQQGACFQTKIQEDGDDDGNSYFYNGAYRAQYNRYSAFFLCEDENCNYDQRYVADLDDYLKAMTNYVDNMCNACANNCRRRLEDAEEEEMAEDWEVNCKTCSKQCNLLWKNNGGNDETDYLECQYSMDYNDIAYYSAPLCQDGSIVIGHFYDEDCTVKAALEFNKDLSYKYFRTIESISVDCSSGLCNDLYDEAVDCNDAGDNDEAKICKAATEASKIRTYYRKPWFKKVPVKAFLSLAILLGIVFISLSYVYYVRHRRAQVPLANLDGVLDADKAPAAEYGQMA